MSEFETALREALRSRAGDPLGWSMPPGTKRRVKGRQLMIGSAGAAVALAAILLATSILTNPPRVDRTRPATDTFEAPVWPDMRPGADGTPYVEHVRGQQVVGQKIPVAHGEVTTPFSGGPVAYSLVVWHSAGGSPSAGTLEAGAWVDLFLGYRATEDPSTLAFDAVGGGVQERLSDLFARPPSKQLFLIEVFGAEGEDEHLVGLAGLVTMDVARLEMRSGGEVEDVALVADPSSDDRRLFVAFPPLDPTGEVASSTLVALGADGSEKWSREIRSLFPPQVEAGEEELPERGA